MRIAFDLDSTLIRDNDNFPLENKNIFQKMVFIRPFSIDVIIDNSESVYQDGIKYNFKVIKASPNHIKWSDKVLIELKNNLS